jgi:iron complex outermembrane receptor protein
MTKVLSKPPRLALFAMLLAFITAVPAKADNFAFAIDPQDLSTALKLFAVQSHREIFFAPELTRSKKSKGVKGTFDDMKALKIILEGTGLNFSVTASNAILVNDPSSKSHSSQAGASTTSGSAPPETGNPTSLAHSRTSAQSQSVPVTSQNSQDVPNTSSKTDESQGLAEILVKGSRIMNVDVTRTEDDVQPYYIFDSETIEQSGAASVDDFLKQRLTMNTTFTSNLQQNAGLANNTSTINLRGLGANETLILVDGRRSASVTIGGAAGQPDINGIPLSAIERIEILPSSASAIYGGAAIGGVVNIILKKNYKGGELRVSFDNTTSGSAPIRTVSGAYGFSLEDGKTQVMLMGQGSDTGTLELQDRLNLVNRGISTLMTNNPSFLYNTFTGGSTPNITSVDYDNNGNQIPLTLRNGTPLQSPITFIPVGAAPNANIAAGLVANAGKANLNIGPGTGTFGLQSPINVAPHDTSFMATIRREMSSTIDVFSEFSTESNSTKGAFNPISSVFVPSTATTNPFQQDVYMNLPTAVSSPASTDSVTQRATVGLVAHLPAGWASELDYTWSRNSFEYVYDQYDAGALQSALNAGTLNPFVDTLAYPLNLAPYLTPTSYSGNSTLDDLGLRASGPVGTLPWGRPELTVGLEHRKEGFHDSNFYVVSPVMPANDQHTVYFGQSQSTESAYMEALVPLVTDTNAMPLLKSLTMQLAGRSEHYNVTAGTPFAFYAPDGSLLSYSPPQGTRQTIEYTSTNPTIGLKYKPVMDVTFRVSYAKAFLPPTAIQLLPNPTQSDAGFITDPRNGQYYDVSATYGGNPNLKPQTSRDWDAGMIWEPQAINGLRMDLEHYAITQPNYIANPTLQQIVDDPTFASRVTRDPTTGRITVVNLSPVNATQYKTDGWDLTLSYRKPTSYGTFDFRAVGTRIVNDLRQYAIGSPALEYAGFPGDGGETKTKANASLNWEYRRWTLGWTTTYFGSYSQIFSPGSPSAFQYGASTAYTSAQGGNTIHSQTYHSIFGSYNLAKAPVRALSNITVQFGIKNLFNTLPPFDAADPPYYYSAYGDLRLRDYWINLRKSF